MVIPHNYGLVTTFFNVAGMIHFNDHTRVPELSSSSSSSSASSSSMGPLLPLLDSDMDDDVEVESSASVNFTSSSSADNSGVVIKGEPVKVGGVKAGDFGVELSRNVEGRRWDDGFVELEGFHGLEEALMGCDGGGGDGDGGGGGVDR